MSPYQTATTEIVTRSRLTFAVRSRVYLHHKCFGIQLDLPYHTNKDMTVLVVEGQLSQIGRNHCSQAFQLALDTGSQ